MWKNSTIKPLVSEASFVDILIKIFQYYYWSCDSSKVSTNALMILRTFDLEATFWVWYLHDIILSSAQSWSQMVKAIKRLLC